MPKQWKGRQGGTRKAKDTAAKVASSASCRGSRMCTWINARMFGGSQDRGQEKDENEKIETPEQNVCKATCVPQLTR